MKRVREAMVCAIGLGYVGLSLVETLAKSRLCRFLSNV